MLPTIVRDFPVIVRVLEYSIVKVLENFGFYVTAKVEEVSFLSDDTMRCLAGERRHATYEGCEAERLNTLTPEQIARQRTFEIDRLIETLEPLSVFKARWEIAQSTRDYASQKRLLHLALARVVVRGQNIEKVEASRAFAHLLRNTLVGKDVKDAEPGNDLMAQLLG